MPDKDTQVNLAVYMERLDSYISSQNALNENLSKNLEKVETKVDDIFPSSTSVVLKFVDNP